MLFVSRLKRLRLLPPEPLLLRNELQPFD